MTGFCMHDHVRLDMRECGEVEVAVGDKEGRAGDAHEIKWQK